MERQLKFENDAYWYFGGIASAGACIFTHPTDLVRVQMQAQLKFISASDVLRLILKYRGLYGLCYGLSGSVIRQLNYSATRFGIYESAKNQGWVDTFSRKVIVAGSSGLIAGFTNAPLEKVNIHMRVDASRPPETRRNYRNLRDGLTQLYKKGGKNNLYSCAITSAFRGMTITVGQLAIYEQIKEKFVDGTIVVENWETYFFASIIAGGIATFLTLPLDVVNTVGKNAEYNEYRNGWHVVLSIFRENGVKGFYKGFIQSLCRFVPQTVLTFFFYEKLRINFGKRT